MEYIDTSNYVIECNNCGSENFKRFREVEEVEYLGIDGDTLYVDDSDTHQIKDWLFECCDCGECSSEIEDLLKEKDDEDDEELSTEFSLFPEIERNHEVMGRI